VRAERVLRRGDWRRAGPKEDIVLVDHRTYRIKPGMTQAHLEIYEKHGLAAQTRHLGQPMAYMFAESGDVNTIVHDWAYEDAADRTRRRAAMGPIRNGSATSRSSTSPATWSSRRPR